jgi:hypothetical protein
MREMMMPQKRALGSSTYAPDGPLRGPLFSASVPAVSLAWASETGLEESEAGVLDEVECALVDPTSEAVDGLRSLAWVVGGEDMVCCAEVGHVVVPTCPD